MTPGWETFERHYKAFFSNQLQWCNLCIVTIKPTRLQKPKILVSNWSSFAPNSIVWSVQNQSKLTIFIWILCLLGFSWMKLQFQRQIDVHQARKRHIFTSVIPSDFGYRKRIRFLKTMFPFKASGLLLWRQKLLKKHISKNWQQCHFKKCFVLLSESFKMHFRIIKQ